MPQVGARPRSLDEVAWHDWLFRCLAATMTVQLNALEAQLETWGPTAMVVLVVCYLHRLARPLAVSLNEVVEGATEVGPLAFHGCSQYASVHRGQGPPRKSLTAFATTA